jgi:hypothetical protein
MSPTHSLLTDGILVWSVTGFYAEYRTIQHEGNTEKYPEK